ncbi:MAG: ABC transporter ATP-binding protein [Ruminococcaceae bacterium]|nr:ABC transporter ATP-binding protein [Oscillospiraceae bacterium]
MLPLDKLSDKALKILEKNGLSENDIAVCLSLDLDLDGNFSDDFLCVSADKSELIYIGEKDEKIVYRKRIENILELSIDNYTTSNRVIARSGKDKAPRKGEGSHEEFCEKAKEYAKGCTTEGIGCCTNAKKRKLLAFVNIFDKFADGKDVMDDDSIFEQFNAKCPKCGKVYEDQLRRICDDCTNKKGTFVRLMGYLGRHKLCFGIAMFSLIAIAVLALLHPLINGKLLFDQVITKPNAEGTLGQLHELKYLWMTIGLIVGTEVLSQLFVIWGDRNLDKLGVLITQRMKNDIFRAMCNLQLSYFNKNPTGRLITRVDYDADKIRNFFVSGLPHLIINVMKFIGIAVLLFGINWKLTLVVFVPVPIIVVIFKVMLPKLWRSFSKQWRRSSALNAMLGDSLSGIRVVKSFSKEADETSRFMSYSTRLYEANLRTNLISICIFPVVSLLIGFSSQAIWGVGGFEVMNESMTYGEFTMYLGYVGMIFAPLEFFTNFTNILTDVINSADRMFETLDTVPEITNSKDAVKPDKIKGDIKFDSVSFHYSPNRPILKNVSFHIKPGDHVGLVGHTGSGKSTIANLITRMYDVISGSVEIDGINVKEIDLETLRKNVAIVSQEVFLFRGTIADNIRYARPDATPSEIIAAAKAANAHDFIMQLPEGYETEVGVGSRSLSGGERQRVSIARALLLAPQLLILDEATAAMDTETEKLISEAIDKLIVGRTTITIAHRLSTLKNCNYIMAIENGEVAEMGPAAELLEKKGVYYKLYTLQEEQMQKVMSGK